MTAIYEFTCFLRVAAESAEDADSQARELADAVSHGEATLALDDSEPTVEAVTEESLGGPSDPPAGDCDPS